MNANNFSSGERFMPKRSKIGLKQRWLEESVQNEEIQYQ
jgi:hypothetical protein